jgi:hypothetical protein
LVNQPVVHLPTGQANWIVNKFPVWFEELAAFASVLYEQFTKQLPATSIKGIQSA